MGNEYENGRNNFGYMAMMLEERDPWDPQVIYHHNRCKMDEHGNWWVSKKSTPEAPNINHPLPGFDDHGKPVASEWWALWIDWQHPMARLNDAMARAISAAEEAETRAGEARSAASVAQEFDGRLSTLESTLQSLTTGDIKQMKTAITNLQSLVGANVDGCINKFNEIVAFLAGIGDTSTLSGLLQDLSAQLARKQPAGDYATNKRVNEVEAKIAKYCSPHFESDALVFPAENSAYFDDDNLILTQ